MEEFKDVSAINISGLAVGLACCAAIILYVNNELTYDTFHKDANRIYRIGTHTINQVGEFWVVKTQGPLGSTIMANYPQVELAVRIVPPYENPDNVLVVQKEKRFFENRVWFADKEIFQMFHIPFLAGNPKKALVNPHTVVITEVMAKKYFGEEPPLDKILQIEIDYDTGSVEIQDYVVTGIVRNSPANTHFKFDMLLSMPTLISNRPSFEENWTHPPPKFTYVKLAPQTNVDEFENQLQQMAKISDRQYMERYNRTRQLYEFFLQSIARIHMHSRYMGEIDIRKVLGASTADIVALLSKRFILLICISVVIASPIALYAMNKWLLDFAYRIQMGWIVFLVAAGGALAIALATVSFQGIRAASSNPVNSLRDE